MPAGQSRTPVPTVFWGNTPINVNLSKSALKAYVKIKYRKYVKIILAITIIL
jgi:hypothetical protein